MTATTISIYLDSRAVKPGQPAPLKLAVRRNGQAAFIALDVKILPEQWDRERETVSSANPNARRITTYIARRKLEAETALLRLMDAGEIASLNAKQIREKILFAVDPELQKKSEEERLFKSRFERYMNLKTNPRTQGIYRTALRHLEAFDSKLPLRRFEDLTKDYIQNFDRWCAGRGMKKNSRNVYLRAVRTVFNDAIDAEITHAYPFRKLSLAPEATRKKALSVEQMRTLINYPCEDCQVQYRDMFLLMFLLRGVNAGDLFLAKPDDLKDGRFDYRRSKVGTLFSVKVEPEAQEIIDRYRGKKHLLCPMDNYSNYKDYLHHMNDELKAIGRPLGKRGKVEGEGICPELSSNWARHTWATVASKLDIPKEIISKGLGHSFGLSVTDIYIDFDNSKVDEANRKIIDFLLYDKA